jgi:hypothetical protein
MNQRDGLATEQPLKPSNGSSACCGSNEAPVQRNPLRNGTTGGPVLFRIPRGKPRVFWRHHVLLEVFGPDGVHEHLERCTFAPSGMNRSRPYGRELSRPPLARVALSRTERDPGRSPISVEGMPRCIAPTGDGHLWKAPEMMNVSTENPDANFENGTLGTLPQPGRCPFGGWFGTD